MIALHASQKNLFSVEPLDKSGSLDFIEQAQIPEVLVRNALLEIIDVGVEGNGDSHFLQCRG